MIFVSTGGVKNKTAYDEGIELINSGVPAIELSGGMHMEGLMTKLKTLKSYAELRLHNYFPPPSVPFVFNLASKQNDVARKSIDHVIQAINISSELEIPFYSFHAGFLLDPAPSELGKKIQKRNVYNREESMELFLTRVNGLSEIARSKGVGLLVENNVLSRNNYMEFKSNPLLMVCMDECRYVMENTPKNVNLLLDVAHLKVSANTLNFDPVKFLDCCASWIKSYHLSDNDGKRDSNDFIDNSAWFWPHLKNDVDDYTLEIYNQSPSSLFKQYSFLLQKTHERFV